MLSRRVANPGADFRTSTEAELGSDARAGLASGAMIVPRGLDWPAGFGDNVHGLDSCPERRVGPAG